MKLALTCTLVRRKFSAYLDQQLSPGQAKRIADHLSTCRACSTELQQITFGAALAGNLPRVAAPESLWLSLQEQIGRTPRFYFKPMFSWKLSSGLAALLLIALLLSWYFGFRQRLYVSEATAKLSEFERAAIEAHSKRLVSASSWQLQTSEIPQLRNWTRRQSGLSLSIPENRPSQDSAHLRLLGTNLLHVEGKSVAEVGYEVDAQPVTLLTAKLSDLPEAPQPGFFSKRVTYRYDREHGYKLLTWGTDGQAYVLVSRLPQYGQQGCFLCHVTANRRKLISSISLQSSH